jgi:phage-related protein
VGFAVSIDPILNLDSAWQISQRISYDNYESQLGDGYQTIGAGGLHAKKEEWDVSRTGLTKDECDALLLELKGYSGWRSFRWRPSIGQPYKVFVCSQWTASELGNDVWQISAKLVWDERGQCEAYRDAIDASELLGWINQLNTWIGTYTRGTQPMIMNAQFSVVNSFHNVLGRGGYFPQSVSTSEGVFLFAHACCQCYRRTGNIAWLNRAINIAESAVFYLYLNQTIPTNVNTVWLPHWATVAKEPTLTKGAVAPNFLNYGYFNVVVNFSNGFGQIPSGTTFRGERLSNVYSVYSMDGALLWENVFAPVQVGTEYPIDYWVSNYLLEGSNFRVFPTTESSAGTAPIATGETAGRVKLVGNFTGQLKVTYSVYEPGNVVQLNERMDFYPMWRQMQPGEINCAIDSLFWAYDAYNELFLLTGNEKWNRAALATIYTTAVTAQVPNLTHWMRKEDSPRWNSYPGVQVVQVNNPNGYTVNRVTSGALINGIRVQVNASPGGSFPSCEVQNFAVQAEIASNTTIQVEVAHSLTTLMQAAVSLSPDAFDFSQLYFANILVNGGSGSWTTRTFLPEDFIKWDNSLVWHPTIADNPCYTYQGNGGSASATRQSVTIPYEGKTLNQVVWRIQVNAGSGGFGGGGFVITIGQRITRPPRIFYRHSGSDARLRVQDSNGDWWIYTLEATGGDWIEKQFQWSDFDGSGTPANGQIPNIDIQAIDGSSTTDVWWMSQNAQRKPKQLDTPVRTYKGSIVTRDSSAYSFWVGTFRPINSPSDILRYSPGVVPFTANSIMGELDRWIGIPLTGYQSFHWILWGYPERWQQVVQLLADAQADYSQQNVNRTTGPFSPAFSWQDWSGGDYLTNGLNRFGWASPDPNTEWEGYAHRALEIAAKGWFYDRSNTRIQRVVMTYLGWLDRYFRVNNTLSPPTNYRQFVDPIALYQTPHGAALIMRAAIYANLAGGSPTITMRLILKMLDYLRSQRVSTTGSTMLGTFSAGQPTFTQGGQTYRQDFGFWVGEELLAICLLLEKKDQLTLPPCGVI